MSAFKTSLMLLKIGNSGAPETFTTIGGFRQYELVVNQRMVDATDILDSSWRSLQANAGQRYLSISGSGLYTDSSAEQQLQSLALSGGTVNFQCVFPKGNIVQAAFMVQQYYRGGSIEGEESFRVMLESAGDVTQL
jgi:predicted secreted protein